MAHGGTTVFFSSHTLSEVEDLCERVAIVRKGVIVADSTLTALRATARHDVDIVWDAASGAGAPERAPDYLRLSRQSADRWIGTLDGDINPLLAFLATRRVADVRIAKPDLETLFRRYYDNDELADSVEAGTQTAADSHRLQGSSPNGR
jgi:ABC-2 type transport system ATP-binding protein